MNVQSTPLGGCCRWEGVERGNERRHKANAAAATDLIKNYITFVTSTDKWRYGKLSFWCENVNILWRGKVWFLRLYTLKHEHKNIMIKDFLLPSHDSWLMVLLSFIYFYLLLVESEYFFYLCLSMECMRNFRPQKMMIIWWWKLPVWAAQDVHQFLIQVFHELLSVLLRKKNLDIFISCMQIFVIENKIFFDVIHVILIWCEESEGSSDEEDTRDMEGKIFTPEGMEVIFLLLFLDVQTRART